MPSSLLKRVVSVVLLCISVFICAGGVNATGYTWHVVGSDHFAGISLTNSPMAISSDGTIYVAYADANNGNKANVMKYDGSDWSVVGALNFSAGGANDLSLVVDATGTPYVAYVDVASSSRANVMKYDGLDWVTVGNADFSTSSIQGTFLALNPSGIPYVTFIDVGNSYAPTIMKLNGSTWEAVGSAYAAQGGAPTMAFNASGTPYVAFSDIAFGNPTVISFDGSDWNLVGGTIPINLYGNCPIAISPNGTPYIVTSDVSAESHIQTYAFNGSTWGQVGSDFVASSTGNFVIAINPSGTPYVSLLDLDSAKGTVIAYDGASWEIVGDALFTSSAQNPVLPLVIGPNGGPYVTYSDSELSNYMLTVKAYLPTVPGRVTGLSASSLSSESIVLSWNALTDTGGSDIGGYRIERKSSAEQDFSTTIMNTGSTALTYTLSRLLPETRYNYRVSAINDVGAGMASAVAAAVTRPSPGGGHSFIPVEPTSVGVSGTPLAFTINSGAQTTVDATVLLDFNANPQTVRGYTASLDPSFKNASIYPLEQRNFTLPTVSGSYTIYLKYYSTTGLFSPVLSQSIAYQVGTVGAPFTTSTVIARPALRLDGFKRILKLGNVGPDVKVLQQFLNNHGFIVRKTGAGSPNSETEYFGSSTAAAVTRFQEANAALILVPNGLMKGTGVFGVGTRKVVTAMLGEFR